MEEVRRWLDNHRETEFPALKDHVYLDHAGTTLVSRRQLDGFRLEVLSSLHGNPHSHSASSQLTTDTIDQVRYRILQYFNTSPEEYTVVFTSGCTASLKLITETFDFRGNQRCHGDKPTDIDSRQITANKYNRVTDNPELDYIPHRSQETHNQRQFLGDHKFPGNEQYLKADSKKTECPGCGKKGQGSFTYLVDNHTSVQGMREIALARAGQVNCIRCDHKGNALESKVKVLYTKEQFTTWGNNLFAYPAQSNYSGWKYPLEWVEEVRQGRMDWQRSWEGDSQGHHHGNRWFVLLDAAALVCTSPLDLGAVKPDFVTLSFYKMFGFPTGLGALLVRNDAGHLLKKAYYGGGTVEVSLPSQLFHVSRSSLSDRLEDGTVSFLDIIALRHGFDALENLAGGISAISEHTFSLARYFYDNLTACCHGNGSKLAEVYTYGDFKHISKQGAVVNFNLKNANGEYIGFATVDSMLQLHNIHVRTGCFCNIGACQQFLKMTDEQIKENFEAGHVCGDNNDLIDGRPTGSIRVSFGYMSTLQDAQTCLQVLVDCFLEHGHKPVFCDRKSVIQSSCYLEPKPLDNIHKSSDLRNPQIAEVDMLNFSKGLELEPKTMANMADKELATKSFHETAQAATAVDKRSVEKVESTEEFSNCSGKHLSEICLYPVKSCAAFKVSRWPLGERGLLYDREWMVVTESGIAMSQKRERQLCLLQPSIDTQRQTLGLDFPGMEPVEVPLHVESSSDKEIKLCNSRVCGDRVQSVDCGDKVGLWLSEALKRPGCRLIRQKSDDKRSPNMKLSRDACMQSVQGGQLSLANISQYLLISRDSVASLHGRIYSTGYHFGENSKAEQATGELTGEIREAFDVDNLVERFRGNLIVSGCEAFEEDSWNTVQIGNIRFTCGGPCTRCQMICMDQRTGQKSTEPLKTLQLWKERKTTFGIHMNTDSEWTRPEMEIKVGDPVFPDINEGDA